MAMHLPLMEEECCGPVFYPPHKLQLSFPSSCLLQLVTSPDKEPLWCRSQNCVLFLFFSIPQTREDLWMLGVMVFLFAMESPLSVSHFTARKNVIHWTLS